MYGEEKEKRETPTKIRYYDKGTRIVLASSGGVSVIASPDWEMRFDAWPGFHWTDGRMRTHAVSPILTLNHLTHSRSAFKGTTQKSKQFPVIRSKWRT
jgi:hypothetical protein